MTSHTDVKIQLLRSIVWLRLGCLLISSLVYLLASKDSLPWSKALLVLVLISGAWCLSLVVKDDKEVGK